MCFVSLPPHDAWPLQADSAEELREKLVDLGHLLPLPSEPAALANVIEIEFRQHLVQAVVQVAGA